jgi:hypothetical protein
MLNIKEVLDKLEERFINKLPTTDVTSFELGKLVGNQEVVEFIFSIIEQDKYKKSKK